MTILYPNPTSCKKHNSLVTWMVVGVVFSSLPALANEEDLMDMSIEALMNIQVTSVSKKSQSHSDSVAAVFVITSEDCARSGATAIPELLRMVPGLTVARIDFGNNLCTISSEAMVLLGLAPEVKEDLSIVEMLEIIVGPNKQEVYSSVVDSIRARESFIINFQRETQGSTEQRICMHCEILTNENGNPGFLLGVVQDSSSR